MTTFKEALAREAQQKCREATPQEEKVLTDRVLSADAELQSEKSLQHASDATRMDKDANQDRLNGAM